MRRLISEALPRPLDQNQIAIVRQFRETADHVGQEPLALAEIVARRHRTDALATHHHLGPAVGFGLKQNRVHRRQWRPLRRPRLQRLRPSDLAAILGDSSIVGHILRLERRNAESAMGEGAAEPGNDQ